MEDNKQEGIFLNGKGQVIKMLQSMEINERKNLINLIKKKNPQLANELSQNSVNFNDFSRLETNEIINITKYIHPTILGMALKNLPVESQRKILTIIDKKYAEEAFITMNTFFKNQDQNIKRAQNKILETLSKIKKQH